MLKICDSALVKPHIKVKIQKTGIGVNVMKSLNNILP